ncbi:M20/M25/M40 family metallo-hydrolase [bacterium]|nr:M20/M25/M40 family metallo-hydrolase [candidate division CSSED10-310 bacterium]
MKQFLHQITYYWFLTACFAGQIQGTPVTGAAGSPGAARIQNTAGIDIERTLPVLWRGPDFVLILPGSHPAAITLVEPDPDRSLYLVQETLEKLRSHFPSANVIPIDHRTCLMEVPESTVWTRPLPESAVYLGYPGPIADSRVPTALPMDISPNARIQAWVDAVDPLQLMADLTTLTDFQTRNSYTQGCRDAGIWLGDTFTNLGYSVSFQEHDRQMAPNVIAERRGVSLPEEIVILCGHYDSISLQPQTLAPGADDNGTGTAAVVHAARIFANTFFDRTLRFIAFSGEEQGLRGSQAYAQAMLDAGEQIIAVINLDMIGYVDSMPEELEIIGNESSSNLVGLFADCAATYTDLPVHTHIDGTVTASDHASFWSRGYTAVLGIEDNPIVYPYYHSIDDTVDKINADFLTRVTRSTVAVTAHAAEPVAEWVFVFDAEWDDSGGDGDGYLDPGETVDVIVSIMNNSPVVSGPISLTMLCLSGSQYVTLSTNSVTIPNLLPGQQIRYSEEPFVVQVRSTAPEFTELTCIIAVQCEAPHSSGYFFFGTATSYEWNDAVISFPMDTSPGWTADNPVWSWGEPQGMGGGSNGNPDPDAGFTGQNVLGTNLAGDYPPNIYATVTSPVLDLTQVRDAELCFYRWLNVEAPLYDRARVWIITGEGTQQIWGNSTEVTDCQWMPVSIPIGDWVDGRDDVRIALSLQTDDGWEYSGWNIDDIRIAGLAPGDPFPTPTPSPEPNTAGIRIVMPDRSLEPGDAFRLDVEWWNDSPISWSPVAVFLILDVHGAYWFWPGWTSQADHETWNLPSGTPVLRMPVLNFVWPDITGPSDGLKFWAAMTPLDASHIIGSYDFAEWSYQ